MRIHRTLGTNIGRDMGGDQCPAELAVPSRAVERLQLVGVMTDSTRDKCSNQIILDASLECLRKSERTH